MGLIVIFISLTAFPAFLPLLGKRPLKPGVQLAVFVAMCSPLLQFVLVGLSIPNLASWNKIAESVFEPVCLIGICCCIAAPVVQLASQDTMRLSGSSFAFAAGGFLGIVMWLAMSQH
jgi:hypothetical protein